MPRLPELTKFTKNEIDALFEHATPVLKNKYAVILSAPATKNFGRILIIVQKKIGNAPTRNLLRRRLKHVFYENKLYDYKQDLIFIARKSVVQLSFDKIRNLICDLFIDDIMSKTNNNFPHETTK